MNPLAFLNPARWMLYAALCAALAGGYVYWQHHERKIGAAPYIAQLATVKQSLQVQKAETAKLLTAETDRVNATQRQLDLAIKTQESNDERNKQENDRMAARLHALAAANAGRLRDPNAGRGGGSDRAQGASAGAAQTGAGDAADAGGLLSADLSGLLLNLTASADRINAAYASCRAWAQAAGDALR